MVVIPKKVLVGAAEVIDWNRRMQGKGITDPNKLKIHWPDLMNFKRSFTEQFSKAGIIAFHGRAMFIGEKTVIVDDTHTLGGKHILIATGAQPMKLNIPGEDNICKSDQFLELTSCHQILYLLEVGIFRLSLHILQRELVQW